MSTLKDYRLLLIVLFVLMGISSCVHLFAGQINIGLSTVFDALFYFESDKPEHIIVLEFRVPRLVMTLLAGSALSVAGLLMQTLFNNPLAGPNVLGISSGSALFVALTLMTGIPFLSSDLGIMSSALIGAFIFGAIILGFSFFVHSHLSLLLIGLMLGSFTSAFISVLQTFSLAQELKVYTIWAMGSLQQVSLAQLPLILALYVLAIGSTVFLIKPLNALVLGYDQAELLGIRMKRVRFIILTSTALLTGLITAFCGPIAFVGLAVPNLVKLLFKTQRHSILLLSSLLLGGIFLVICDIIVQLLEQQIVLPINAITSLIGAPFVIFIILKRFS